MSMKAKPSTPSRSRRRPWPGWLNAQTVATTMLILGIALGAAGFVLTHGPLAPALQLVEDFYANIAAELVSIAITVLIIDRLNERRSVDQEKQLLILQLASPTNAIAHEAARLLHMRGWLTGGSLQGAKLGWANLSRVLLNNADLAGADFFRVNLQHAYLACFDPFTMPHLAHRKCSIVTKGTRPRAWANPTDGMLSSLT